MNNVQIRWRVLLSGPDKSRSCSWSQSIVGALTAGFWCALCYHWKRILMLDVKGAWLYRYVLLYHKLFPKMWSWNSFPTDNHCNPATKSKTSENILHSSKFPSAYSPEHYQHSESDYYNYTSSPKCKGWMYSECPMRSVHWHHSTFLSFTPATSIPNVSTYRDASKDRIVSECGNSQCD